MISGRISCGKEKTMMNTVVVLSYFHMEHYEALSEYSQSLNFMRSNGIMRKRKLYEYH